MPSGFDISRIEDHPDKRMLNYLQRYYKAFTDPNPEQMWVLQTKDFKITDIPLGIVKVNRDIWYNINKNFFRMITDCCVTALSLSGSSEPGSYSSMECVVSFKLTADPPPGPADNLPAGAKAGDTVRQINLDNIWWDAEGRATRELVYGRLVWPNFSIGEFDAKSERPVLAKL